MLEVQPERSTRRLQRLQILDDDLNIRDMTHVFLLREVFRVAECDEGYKPSSL
jgi:hypothetical protein